ncbi:MAG: response regulator [Pseudomonadota bacterium]
MRRILAIDDNPDNLTTIKALLKLFLSNHDIITALSGREGIQKAISEQPDTILLDIHMPEMDGFEVCKQLKTLDQTAHIPIIMLTAVRTDSQSRVKALNLGADAFLTKPVDESELAAQVKAMLRIKKAEDILRNEKEALEELVAQRVNELSIANDQLLLEIKERELAQQESQKLEQQLRQSQKMEAVGALAGGIAHDFNNILYPIIGFAELLKEDMLPTDPGVEAVDEIFKAALRAKELVKQILTFSRQMDQEIKPVKIQDILKETISLTNSVLPSTITINQHIDTGCRPVMADPSQIHQMIMNLVTNAYHAMEESGGILSITLSETSVSFPVLSDQHILPGDYVCLKIHDTGMGIKEDILHHIFNPYFTTKKLNKGTGLGLSVVHGIAKNTKGEIFVHSIPGKETCFEVYLPVLQETT